MDVTLIALSADTAQLNLGKTPKPWRRECEMVTANSNGLAVALRRFVIEPAQKRSSALFFFQLAQLINDRTGGRYDALVQWALSVVKRKITLPTSPLMDAHAIASSVTTLKKRGWDILPWRLSAADVAELRHFAFTTPAYAVHPCERIAIAEDSIPRTHGRYVWLMSELIRVPAVQRLLADGVLYRLAQDYIGCEPLLTSITLWLETTSEAKVGSQNYHYDNDGPSFLKFFIYLSDIDDEAGAHTYIQGTHRHLKPRQFDHAGFYDRDDLLGFFGAENEIVFKGPAGMILAEDTAGFHKGTKPKNYRLLLQVQYATLDIPHEEELAGLIDRVLLENLDPGIKRIARKIFA